MMILLLCRNVFENIVCDTCLTTTGLLQSSVRMHFVDNMVRV